MAIPVLPYKVKHYNSLPELQVANSQFECVRASNTLFTEIGKAFVNHHVENKLGVALLHNHFLLEPCEMLVSIDSVAVPWDTRNSTETVNASSWRFTENGIAPYEFTHEAPEIRLDCQPMQSFLLELRAILMQWNLANILGICSLNEKPIDRPATMEFTSGRANITLPFDIAPNDGNNVDAMWQFSSHLLGSIGLMREGKRTLNSTAIFSRLTKPAQRSITYPNISVNVKIAVRENHTCQGIPPTHRILDCPQQPGMTVVVKTGH